MTPLALIPEKAGPTRAFLYKIAPGYSVQFCDMDYPVTEKLLDAERRRAAVFHAAMARGDGDCPRCGGVDAHQPDCYYAHTGGPR